MDAATEALAKILGSTRDAKKHAQAIARFVDARTVELLHDLRMGMANASDKIHAEVIKNAPGKSKPRTPKS